MSKRIIGSFLCVLFCSSLLCAQESSLESTPNRDYQNEENLTSLQQQARDYRSKGLELQRMGDIDSAMSLYQKAVDIDPGYVVVYNDLGIALETNGWIDKAEEYYLKAIKIDPGYLSAYTNLALLYENKRDLEKAFLFWAKRSELGSLNDPWTVKARQRQDDISLILSKSPVQDSKEREVLGLIENLSAQKAILRQDDLAMSRCYFEKAKASYKKQDYATAIKEALDAQQLDPANKEIVDFIDKVQLRALSR